ncbi:hypothetical protein CHS0354_012297 [Potamilus streckersoni]|uniref:F-box domain-containing protein n=1 Tax=Potamilus streckersoni TaxID=2493646 RepID=A0AAE0SES5_9BIVA|nr:hypothetical protein CHS0354_012297 [Potamilus streckersoni]
MVPMSRVCKKWRRVTNDNSLWHHVDLSPYRLNLQKVWKIIRVHLSECLLSIKLRGFMDLETKWKTQSVSNAMLDDIRDRCPNVKELHLYYVNVNSVDGGKLPSTLHTLKLDRCSWQPRWIKSGNPSLPNLRSLSVSHCVRVDNYDIQEFCQYSNLEKLNLCGCYRVKDCGLQNVAENLPHLTHLDIAATSISDLSVHHISRNMKDLQHLCLRRCSEITNGALATLVSSLKKLRYLDISECSSIDADGLRALNKLESLSTLLCGPNIPNTVLEELQTDLPLCNITCITWQQAAVI